MAEMEAKVSPWGSALSTTENLVSFSDVMSEELAKDLHTKELFRSSMHDADAVADFQAASELGGMTDTSSDEILAKMLQLQFDQEYDRALGKEEAKYNGTSKVSVSLSNYRMIPKGSILEDDSDYEEDSEVVPNWDHFEATEKESPSIPRCGYSKQKGQIVTKHDTVISGRKNACRVMEFPPGIETGDGGGFDMKLSNRVYNNLKVYSMNEQKRAARLHDKVEKSTAVMALDPKSRLILYRMVDNNILDRVNGIISTGKEAVILHGEGGQPEALVVPRECAVKVFKTTLNEFKSRDEYIRDDYRFRARFSKQNPRKMIHMWAEKEMHNLTRMKKAGLRCPDVVLLKKHILLMSFIGNEGRAAPKLKEAALNPSELEMAHAEVVQMMEQLYRECNLVHGDLSEYNVLWHDGHCWFIDVSQAVDHTHPRALEFLYRDCSNICLFFEKQNASQVQSPSELFKRITGLHVEGSETEILNQVQNFEKNEELLTFAASQKVYPFDYCWEKSMEQRKSAVPQ